MLTGLTEPWVRGIEGPETFSPFDVVGHLIDGEETGLDDRFRHWNRNKDRSLESLLDEFGRLRSHNLAELAALNLSPRQLDLTGTHPVLGVVTLRQLLASWVAHDLGHIAQVARVMAKQYKEEAGPWVPVLTDHEKPRS